MVFRFSKTTQSSLIQGGNNKLTNTLVNLVFFNPVVLLSGNNNVEERPTYVYIGSKKICIKKIQEIEKKLFIEPWFKEKNNKIQFYEENRKK